ncbi:HAL/PAL/TAL family ammonia-lyase [Heyndrickxia faecalis]|uniref:HAL/PAL/TAL family ammonia-lyase n=1 Tax=Heyndrickxia faecalis TaxID=2824910 RepID=UPI003D1A5CAA
MLKTVNNILSENPKKYAEVILSGDEVSIEEFIAVARYNASVSFSNKYITKIQQSRSLLDSFLLDNKVIYGVTTGFGDNVRSVISTSDAETLQVNIIRSHAVSVGSPLEGEVVRGILLMMLINFGKGLSGVSYEVVNLIKEILNKKIIPYAPGEGSVGYLSIEAQISLLLIGEGKAWYKGTLLNGGEALRQADLAPIKLKCKEGLALLSGSTSVTALAILCLYNAVITTKTFDIIGAMTFECLKGTVNGLDHRLHQVKNHSEQQETAENLLLILKNSEIMRKYENARVQDPYPIRCLPQILGAVKRTLKEAWISVFEEMNSCTDNPIIYFDDNEALMGGNFDGTYVGIHMDSTSIAMGNLAKLSERLTDRLVNRHLNEFPPFLAKNPGLESGLMIPQYTAAGLVGEIRVLSHPASVDSVSTCANQEDPVSFAYFAAKKAYDISKKLEYIVSIQTLANFAALDFIKNLNPSPTIQKVCGMINKKVKKIEKDRHYYLDIEHIKNMIHERDILDLVEKDLRYLKF